MRLILLLLLLNPLNTSNSWAKDGLTDQLKTLQQMPQASLLVQGDPEISIRADQGLIPASTLKLLTALLALETWGREHRFITDFELDDEQILWVKGYGDPLITSEEMEIIAARLKQKGLKKINGIGLDQHYFASQIRVDGRSNSSNPYDASNNALAANFNTISIKRKQGKTYSAEPQTPLTKLARSLADDLPNGEQRINLGKKALGPRYFAELLAAKLEAADIRVQSQLINGTMPNTDNPYYRHRNSHSLDELITLMMHYSNNFIANQLFLLLGVENAGAPATLEKSQAYFEKEIQQQFGWQDYRIVEGSGLSRKNRLSATQLVEVLEKFSPYRDLLKRQNQQIYAKSGTLKGISCYAGYLQRQDSWRAFALIINQPVDYQFRKRLAEELTRQ